jgi:hypothetical protein
MFNFKRENALENITILAYAILLSIVSYYHEPWFDEAQAWLIARDSSLFDMIWHVLRYEGHTPLWYLVLYIPAHLNVPFELGIKTANFIFAVPAAALFIKACPFPRVVRLLTPFTYFLFYQYGVISRSYSLFMLVLWILAAIFPYRNKRPLLFSTMLAFLGGISAYGIILAFGIALAWLIEIFIENRSKSGTTSLSILQTVRDSRFYALVFLGLIHIGYIAILWPMPDRHTPQHFTETTFGVIAYRFLIAPVGSLFFSEIPASFLYEYKTSYSFYLAVVGLLLITAFLLWAFKKGIHLYVLLPYTFLTLFMSFVYFSQHHTGLFTLFAIFAIWISLNNGPVFGTPAWAQTACFTLANIKKYPHLCKRLFFLCLAFFLLLQTYWSLSASLHDIRLPYASHRELASFIRKNKLEGRKIFDFYYVSYYINSYHTKNNAALAYFPVNIFFNHNPDNPKISYATHRKLDDRFLIKFLKSSGKPEFLIWNNKSLPYYDDLFTLTDYLPVRSFEGYYMWKDYLQPDSIVFYVRKDLLSRFPILQMQKP